jgi:hypothetical protein
MKCSLCGSTRIRTSRLRGFDFARLIVLQFPVRCRECYDRAFVNVFLALTLRESDKGRDRKGLRSTENRDNSTPDQA